MSGSLLHPCTSWDTIKDVGYSSLSTHCTADLYVPKNNGTSQNPLLINVHGGAWAFGDKADGISYFYPLIKKGFAILSINYRFEQEHVWPIQLVDVKSAVRFIRQFASVARVWPTKIGLMGQSAGGHMVLMSGLTNGVTGYDQGDWLSQSSSVAVVLSDYGITDLARCYKETQTPALQPYITNLIGASPIDRPDIAWADSPMSLVAAPSVPMMLRAGTGDTLVPYAQSTAFHDAMVAVGNPASAVTMRSYTGYQHADSRFYTSSEVTGVISPFFDAYLRP